MVEPKDIILAKREKLFVPDEVLMLIFVCSEFAVL